MLFVELDQTTVIMGGLSLIIFPIWLLMSGDVLYKAIKSKNKALFVFFLVLLTAPSPWIPVNFGYLYWSLTGNLLSYRAYILLGTVGVPISMMCWIYIYLSRIRPKYINLVLIPYGILSMFYYIYLFYFLYFVPGAPVESMIGIETRPLDITYRGLILVYMIIALMTGIVTGIHFSIVEMKNKEYPIDKWKGRFLLISFMFFGIGATADSAFELTLIALVIFRVFLAFSVVFFYIGFIMPEWIRNIFVEPVEDIDELEEFLRMFTKPEYLTEKEITFYREQKICLVCKSQVSRLTYICPKCDTLYCVKCSDALSKLENACWVCETPIDETKPVKLFKKEVEKIPKKAEKKINKK